MHSKPTARVRRPGRIAALGLALVFALGAAAHAAPAPSSTPTFDPNNPEDAKLQKVFKSFDTKRDSIESRLQAVGQELLRVETELAKVRATLAKAEAELAKRRTELAAAIAKLNAQKALLKDSAAEIYIRGPYSYLNAILNAEDISSIVSLDVYSESVLGDFIRVLHEVQALRARVEKLYKAIRARTLELRAQNAKLEAEEAKILVRQQQAFNQRQSLINGLVADFGGLDALKAHGFDIIIRSYAGTSTRITNELTEAQKTAVAKKDVARTGEYLLQWPVDEHRITSRYGWRIHPLWGYRSYHTGIDIGSPYGAPVKSVADGRVVDVAYMGAYGLAIIIDNGHAIGTVYAHLSRTNVAKGDIVHQGDQIGNVGCSGWCTGPHIHFEVRVASKPQNPIFWL
jgi:murein DD-endopeptidase MepM/ murein hydrolase activator NlpD